MSTARRLAAILAADVVGYSRLMGVDEVVTLQALKTHRREVVDPAIAACHGRIVKTTGDGMLVEFASAVDAVNCAMTVQKSMADRNDANAMNANGSPRIVFRIGINVGDIIIEDDDIFGDGVNVAARVEAECEPGGVYLSANAFEQIRSKTPFKFDDMGERQLKNIDRPVRVYSARVSEPKVAAQGSERPTISSLHELGKPLPLPDKPSIAVLPFQNMSGDPEQEYFADGMVEDIITALSRFKSLFVIARNSSFTYKGKAVDVKRVGRELGVRYVLEGSVRKAGGRVRITGQLIEVATGAHLWADSFDGSLQDVFALQDQVTSKVVGVIAPKIDELEMQRATRKPPGNLVAYDYYLRGMAKYEEWTREGNREAQTFFSRVMELDPAFAEAISYIASCVMQRFIQGWIVDPVQEGAEALRLAKRSLELGREDAFVLASSAFMLVFFTGDVATALSLAERAVTLNPNALHARSSLAWTSIYAGKPEVAIEHALRAIQLNPIGLFSFQTKTPLAIGYFLVGRNDDALAWSDRALADYPNQLPTLRFAAAVKASLGQIDQAQQIARRIFEINPGERIENISMVRFQQNPEYKQRFIDGLRLAGLPE